MYLIFMFQITIPISIHIQYHPISIIVPFI
ncbi:hypothetical protein F383_23882 [Gossypium arboreum]|uniref:Uncharacterized protein n=1 Tax=Gossypium arboreum TaxID=29729 RepID=A0A0B0MPG5_GOSAR|nr:hypothetical protein F383_23882 [Gossypium arboreum]